jgi:hypothetical protein
VVVTACAFAKASVLIAGKIAAVKTRAPIPTSKSTFRAAISLMSAAPF